MSQPRSDSRLANTGSAIIRDGFLAYRGRFLEITQRAKARFEQRDWRGSRQDMTERLDVYRGGVFRVASALRALLGERYSEPLIWAMMKAVYSGMIDGTDDWELAETFFNSITRRLFDTVGVDPRVEFVDSDFETPSASLTVGQFRSYAEPLDAIQAIIEAYGFDAPFCALERDAAAASERIGAAVSAAGLDSATVRADMLEHAFFRGKAGYLVGRLVDDAGRLLPLVLALRHDHGGIRVDAVMADEDSVSILFGFAHAYFRVEAPRPSEVVQFLKTLLPLKRTAELYISLGFDKHGKTELYRDILRHLRESNERFRFTWGIPGMVMIVFTMPSLNLVFKVIRDRFPSVKMTSERAVKERYHLVFKHDRAGRLVDAQPFEHLSFDRALFEDDLLLDLLNTASKCVQLEGGRVVIRHAYVERRITPLDVFIRRNPPKAEAAILDFGRSIKELASSNIFPGDMLLKNFGVTRHGRVIFYDYDELTLLTECRFRRIPPPRNPEDELSDEPWYSVGPSDVFPEEFQRLMGIPDALRPAFEAAHSELYDAAFWQGMQVRQQAGDIIDVYPYEDRHRLYNSRS